MGESNMVKPITKKIIWAVWLLLFPLSLWGTYHMYPPQIQGSEWEILGFLIFMTIVASMPMIINGTAVFFLQWATVSVFLVFGLYIELLLVQIAILAVLYQERIDKKTLFRIPMNSILFLVVSLLSGYLYFYLGGELGIDIFSDKNTFLLVVVYLLTYLLINILGIYFIERVIYGRNTPFFTKDLLWEVLTTALSYPVGVALYMLYLDIGLLSLLLIGVPFISLSLILKLYHSSQTVNDQLKKITEIGHQLSQNLYVEETIDFFVVKLNELFRPDFIYIHQINQKNELEMIFRVEHQEELPVIKETIKENEGICGRVLTAKKPFVFHTEQDWKHVNKGYMPVKIQSVLCVPLIKNNKVIGVLLLGKIQRRAFVHIKLMIIDLLCTQFAIALENAKYFERTKENSEKCALTKLYNYRYFEQYLTDCFVRLQNKEVDNLAIIMLDIDHFKTVNDLYGHQAGNEILTEFAERIQKLIGEHGLVARYGGEEFVILLTNKNIEDVYNLAEFIRKMIASKPFILKQNMDDQKKKVNVNITASLGLASAPQDADEPLALIRHADRALYVGAKRAGRNRVASYMK